MVQSHPSSETPEEAIERADATFTMDDFRATATAFSQVTGLLGGFSITILILVLPRDFLSDQLNAKNWIVGLLLLAASFYVYSASIFANSMNAMALRKFGVRKMAFNHAVVTFHLSNILLGSAVFVLVYQFSFLVGFIAMIIIGAFIIFIAVLNFGLFRIFRKRR